MAIESHPYQDFIPPIITHPLILGLLDEPSSGNQEERSLMIAGYDQGVHVRGGNLVTASRSNSSLWLSAEKLGIHGIINRPARSGGSAEMELFVKGRNAPSGQAREFFVVLQGEMEQTVKAFFDYEAGPQGPQKRKVTCTYTLSPDGKTTVSYHWTEQVPSGWQIKVAEVVDTQVHPDFWNNVRVLAVDKKNEMNFQAEELAKKNEQESPEQIPEQQPLRYVFEEVTNSDIYQRLLDVLGTPPMYADDRGERDVAMENVFVDSIHSERTIPIDWRLLDLNLRSLFSLNEDPRLVVSAKRPLVSYITCAAQIVLEGDARRDEYNPFNNMMGKVWVKRFITLSKDGVVGQYDRLEKNEKGEIEVVIRSCDDRLPENLWAKVCEAALSSDYAD